MHRDINQIASHKFDLLVIGGGINGAAISYLAADNGLSVAAECEQLDALPLQGSYQRWVQAMVGRSNG